MPGREYLLKGLGDKDVKAYLEYQIGLATLLGADKDRARKELVQIVEFEIALANVRFTPPFPHILYWIFIVSNYNFNYPLIWLSSIEFYGKFLVIFLGFTWFLEEGNTMV